MKVKDHAIFEEGECNYHQPVNAGEQTIHRESSTGVCPRDEELSSIDRGVQQTGETSLSLSRCNNLDDMLARIKLNPRIVTIPDDWQKKATEDFLKGGHLDNPGERGRNGSDILREIETKRNKKVKVET